MSALDIEHVADKLRQRAEGLDAIGGTVLLDLGEQGILIDGRVAPLTVAVERPDEADCRVRMALALLDDILDGRRKPFMAFMTGQIGISGDMSVAVKLQPLLSAGG
jgi:putative sterol carrier protein